MIQVLKSINFLFLTPIFTGSLSFIIKIQKTPIFRSFLMFFSLVYPFNT